MQPKTEHEILDTIAQGIYDRKGFNILALDVRNVSSLTDYFIIAEGTVERHIKSIADYLLEILQPSLGSPSHLEGDGKSDWIVIDYVNIVIHLFIPEQRERFALEKLWHEAKIINVKIQTTVPNSRIENE